MWQRRSRDMSKTGVVIYTNEQGWSLEMGSRYIQVRNDDEEFVTGWDRDEPAPSFALDPLEADMVTTLLEQANPASLGEAMAESGHDAGKVVEHLPYFRRKWLEVRKERWAQLFVMEPPEET